MALLDEKIFSLKDICQNSKADAFGYEILLQSEMNLDVQNL